MNRTVVEQIKERLSIEEVVGTYVKLDKAGKSLKARCPFHNEKSASFFVSPERGGYYCFGCGAKGDIFSFIEQFEGLDFRGALKVLAERAGVPLVFDQKADGERDQLFRIMEEATIFFEMEFSKHAVAAEYVKGRGITEETRRSFRIGWAPEGWRNLHTHLRSKGWNDLMIEKAGLAKKSEKDSSFYDRFRGRVMFPMFDTSGRVVAFSGRILVDDGKSAKYLNSPETPLFDKSRTLYGLDRAKSEIRRMNYTILVEGQMDLVMSHQAGIKNTIATSGTALTAETASSTEGISNLELVRRLSPNVILAFDADKAGRMAAMRAVATTAISMGMAVKVADIEGGKDPADLVRANPEDWKDILRTAKHVVEYELGNVLKEVSDQQKIARAVRERIFPYLARMDSAMDQAHFIKMISDKAHITEDAVWQDLRATEKTIKNTAAPSPTTSPDIKKVLSGNDLVDRRVMGLLFMMEASNLPEAATFRSEIEKIAGESHSKLIQKTESIKEDLLFEAEAFFGADSTRFGAAMKELLLTFEEHLISEELISTMHALRTAEKAADTAKMAELAKRCQELSLKKAEVGKKRRL